MWATLGTARVAVTRNLPTHLEVAVNKTGLVQVRKSDRHVGNVELGSGYVEGSNLGQVLDHVATEQDVGQEINEVFVLVGLG